MKNIIFGSFYLFLSILLLQIDCAAGDDEILNINGCLPHITSQREDVSRDYTCVDIKDRNEPCVFQGIAGGEHQTFIQVSGSYGDKFSVSFSKIAGNPMFTITGDGIETTRSKDDETIISIQNEATFFSIVLSAHPFGEYKVNLKKY